MTAAIQSINFLPVDDTFYLRRSKKATAAAQQAAQQQQQRIVLWEMVEKMEDGEQRRKRGHPKRYVS